MRQERAERTRSALVLAAAKMFDRLGYERTTLSCISDAAAVSKGALSFHFASKAELADTVQLMGCASTRSSLEHLRRQNVPALQSLVDMTHATAQQLATNQLVRAGVRLNYELRTPSDGEMNFFTGWYELFLTTTLEAERDHSLRAECHPVTVAGLALSIVCWAFAAQGRTPDEIRLQLTEFWRLLLPALAADQDVARYQPVGSEPPESPLPRRTATG
ncbi:TetR family transcriptional regulator [Streptomyces sp. 6N223]|uniref:TetR family transcriptional regulator n=1 Tax=Streptomyces sp. 6N223 TaxID=3457412 RepID=UPI003FD3A51B